MKDKSMLILGVALFILLVGAVTVVFFVLGNSSESKLSFTKLTQDESNNLSKEGGEEMNSSVKDFEELSIQTVQQGDGVEAKVGNTVVVNYEGTLIDGTKFDSSYDRGTPFEFVLGAGQVITGWEEGVKGMKIGEIRELKIPSSMGYGENGAGNVIPPSAGLIFRVELLEIK